MKTLLVVLLCWLTGPAQAAAPRASWGAATSTVCPGYADLAAAQQMPLPDIARAIDAAIRDLDHARIELPSRLLATGKLTYLSVTVPLPELDQLRVLGYFELHGSANCLIPLVVNHLQTIEGKEHLPDTEQARIYFRAPEVDRFDHTLALHQQLTLRIAVFAEKDGVIGRPYFGRRIALETSRKGASIGAALLFAFGFYLLTAQAVAAILATGQAPQPRRWRALLARLAPWNLVGEGAQTALAQLQMLMFTLIVASLLFYQWLRTGLLQELSTDLLYLIGISTLGAAGSQIGSALKKGLTPDMVRYAHQLDWFTAPLAQTCKRADPAGLLTTNKRFDIYKFQMLVFSIVIAAYVIAAGADELDKLHISATLLTLMGISQGAYVGGNVTSDSMSVLQEQLRGMHTLQRRYRASTDDGIRQELRRRFRLAAARAALPFGTLFGRVIPDYLLEMPIDADSVALADERSDEDAPLAPAAT